METLTNNKHVYSFLKREKYILPLYSNSNTSKCLDFDFNKYDCLKINKLKIIKNHPYPAKEDYNFIAIPTNNNQDCTVQFCDMV